jgi:hypothetical protein
MFSSGGGLNHAWLRDLKIEWREELRLLRHFFAQQRNQIQARRPSGVTAPPGQFGIGASALGAEGVHGSQQERAVCRHRQDGLFGRRCNVP